MVTVIAILMLLIGFNFLLKQTFYTWQTIMVHTLVVALFVAGTWQIAINQSQTNIAQWLASTPLMQNMAVVLSIDIIVQLLFCMVAAKSKTNMPPTTTLQRKIYYAILWWWPGFAIFPVAFALLVVCIFNLPGLSFSLIAYALAFAFVVLIPLLTYLLRIALNDRDMRLEMLFLSNLLVAMIAVVATVKVSTPQNTQSPVNWMATGSVLLLLLMGIGVGTAVYRIRAKHKKQ